MRYYSHDGLTFDLDDSGPEDGPPVVLLHGWPQDRTAWRPIAERLNAAGLRTLAPDLRGYSPGARPPHWTDYEIGELVDDVIALLDAAGIERVHLVGHDWGGALAWTFASRHPERIATLTVLSTPHPAAMMWAMKHADQKKRSAYMLFFAIPILPAFVMRWLIGPMLRRTGMPRDLASYYTRQMRRPGVLTTSLTWYRASITLGLQGALTSWWRRLRGTSNTPARGKGETPTPVLPTTYLWGRDDVAFSPQAAQRTETILARRAEQAGINPAEVLTVIELDEGHWLPELEAAACAEAIIARVEGPSAAALRPSA
ncbi:alpha/beta fold hydrolase [Janibacter sp. GXQ6167]|uniref:alpha/beta fold hydrolase n=1 Tax=Janibacter sp. GXQ6167 TaxID=3240791 RepID=UPI003525475E